MNEILFRRHGDVNLFPISEKQFNEVKGKIIKHNGEWILAKGEATGSVHKLLVKEKENLIIKQDEQGNMYFALSESGLITHTKDHETITTPKKVWYIQTPEREVDWFADGINRKVVD